MISEAHQAMYPGDGTIGASRTALRGARAWLLQAVRGIAMNCALGARLAEHGVSLRLWNLIGRGMIQLTAAQTTFGTMTTRADYDKRFAGPCRCQSAIPAVEVLTWSLVAPQHHHPRQRLGEPATAPGVDEPLYAGLVTRQGKVVGPGDCQPLLDEDTHLGLVTFLTDPSRRHGSAFERKYMRIGIAVCGLCGAKLYAVFSHGRNRRMVDACWPSVHIA
jgi:hypothetical protein